MLDGGRDRKLFLFGAVNVLKTISSEIKNLNWSVSSRSCIDGGFKNETIVENSIISNVTCNCTFQGELFAMSQICM